MGKIHKSGAINTPWHMGFMLVVGWPFWILDRAMDMCGGALGVEL
jgi:hypothetical protein